MMKWLVLVAVTVAVGCEAPKPPEEPAPPRPEITGAGLILDLSPANRPSIQGNYGFELLDEVSGLACATTDMRRQIRYWIGMPELDKLAPDRLTQQAIAAAVHEAISGLEKADSFILTRFVSESKGPDTICVTVFGRGVRLTKEASQVTSASN